MTKNIDNQKDEFLRGYVAAALWASIDDDGTPLDEDHDYFDLPEETIVAMKADCDDFRNFCKENGDMLAGIDEGQAGHDFWLTRNHHGAGFWDRGLGSIGEKLTKAAHTYGSSDLCIGDDGKVYCQ